MLGQSDQAKRCAERGLSLRPIFPQVFHTLGIVALNEDRIDDAIRYFEAVMANSRPSVVDLRNLAKCYERTGHHEKAKANLRRAEALRDEPSAQEATISRTDSGELVIEDEKEGRAEGLCYAGRLLAAEGKLNEARAKFLEAIAEDPELALPHWGLALLEQMGFRNHEKAIVHWKAAQERLSDQVSVGFVGFLTRKLALAHYRQGRLEKAVEVLSGYVSEHGATVGQNDATIRLHERMTVGTARGKHVRLPNVRARHSTEDDSCLPQSLATILEYWKLPNDVAEISSFIGDVSYLHKGLQTLSNEVAYKCFSPNVACLKALIDAGFPVLIGGQFLPRGRDNYMGHATVMVGYDEMLKQVLIEDANWFQGWEMLPYDQLHELHAVVIAPSEKLAELTIDLPDQEYHQELNRLEPIVLENDSTMGPDEFDDMIRLQPNHWWGHFLTGMVARREKDRFAAVRHLKRAVETSSQIASPHLLMAKLYAEDSVVLEAREWLRKALRREPSLHIARKFLIQQLLDPGNKVNDLQSRIQYLSSGRSIKANLEEAITESYRHLDSHPDDEEVLMNLLVCELKLGRFTDGEKTARKLIRRTNHMQMYLWLAISLENQGRYDGAIAAATTGLKLAPDEKTRQLFKKMIDNYSKLKANSSQD